MTVNRVEHDEAVFVDPCHTGTDRKAIGNLVGDRWLADCTLFGPASKVREGLDAWREAGIRTPILVPSSASGNQFRAFEELFAAFS